MKTSDASSSNQLDDRSKKGNEMKKEKEEEEEEEVHSENHSSASASSSSSSSSSLSEAYLNEKAKIDDEKNGIKDLPLPISSSESTPSSSTSSSPNPTASFYEIVDAQNNTRNFVEGGPSSSLQSKKKKKIKNPKNSSSHNNNNNNNNNKNNLEDHITNSSSSFSEMNQGSSIQQQTSSYPPLETSQSNPSSIPSATNSGPNYFVLAAATSRNSSPPVSRSETTTNKNLHYNNNYNTTNQSKNFLYSENNHQRSGEEEIEMKENNNSSSSNNNNTNNNNSHNSLRSNEPLSGTSTSASAVALMIPISPRDTAEEPTNPADGKSKKKSRIAKIFKKFRRICSLTYVIVFATVFLIVAACMASWLIQFLLSSKGIKDVSDSLKVYIGSTVEKHIDSSILAQAVSCIKTENRTSIQASNIQQGFALAGSFFHDITSVFPQVAAIGYANSDSDIVLVGKTRYLNATQFNITSEYYAAINDQYHNVFLFEMHSEEELGDVLMTINNFDFGNTSAFRMLLNISRADYIWTPAQLSLASRTPVITTYTVTAPNSTAPPNGIILAQLELADIRVFLESLDVGDHGSVVIVDTDGHIVQDPCLNGGQCSYTNRISLVKMIDSSVPLYRSIGQRVIEKYGSFGNVSESDSLNLGGYWINFEVLQNSNLKWIVIVATYKQDFLSSVYSGNALTISLICTILVLSIIFLVFLSCLIARPMNRLVKKMDRIADLDFTSSEQRSKLGSLSRKIKRTDSSIFYEISRLQKSMRKMQVALASFEKFVPSSVVKDILHENAQAKLGVQTQEATVFFIDIENFTSYAETINNQKLIQWLGEYLQLISDCIIEHFGTIDKFIGDAVMALWNAPKLTEFHAVHASTCALQCQKRLAIKRLEWKQSGLPMIHSRIGINTGEVLVGNVGSPQRFNYTAIGDNVNIGARLEGLGKHYGVEIIIGEGTYRKVSHRFLCRLLDKVTVKGKLVPLSIYELVDTFESATPEQRDFCSKYTHAMNLLLENDIQGSNDAFAELNSKYPNDKPTSILFNRVKKLLKNRDNAEGKWPGFEVIFEK